MNGVISINDHVVEFRTWKDMGGGWEDLVAWCHTCDKTGERLMTVDLRAVGPVEEAFISLMKLVAAHSLT